MGRGWFHLQGTVPGSGDTMRHKVGSPVACLADSAHTLGLGFRV